MELNKIYNKDFAELFSDIPDNSIDLLLTDPPYGTTKNKWDIPINLDVFWKEVERVTKDNAAILIFSQVPYSAALIQSNTKNFRYEWIVEKNNATGFLNARRMPLKAHENVLVFYNKLPVYHPQMTHGKPYTRGQSSHSSNYNYFEHEAKKNYSGERFPRDVLKVQWRPSFSRTYHPTQKPVSLCEYFIKTYTDEGATILDPFIGSGTTAAAAVNTNRNYIGGELSKEYYDIAIERMSNIAKNGDTER